MKKLNSTNLSLTSLNIRRGPFALYNGLNRFTTMRETLNAVVLLENEAEGKWQVCCEFRGAAERPE